MKDFKQSSIILVHKLKKKWLLDTIQMQMVPEKELEQEMTASPEGHISPLSSQQPKRWRACLHQQPTTVHFPPVQTSYTNEVKEEEENLWVTTTNSFSFCVYQLLTL